MSSLPCLAPKNPRITLRIPNTILQKKEGRKENGATKAAQFRRDRERKREREGGEASTWSTRRGRLIRVDELARSIQPRLSRNPDLLSPRFVSSGVSVGIVVAVTDRSRGFCQLLADLTRGGTCIRHVTVRRHLTAAGRALERVKVTARRLFQVCVQNGGDVHVHRSLLIARCFEAPSNGRPLIRVSKISANFPFFSFSINAYLSNS